MGERLSHCDLGQHEDAAALGRHHQLVRRSLPARLVLVALRLRGDILAGIAQRSKLSAIVERDRLVETFRDRDMVWGVSANS